MTHPRPELLQGLLMTQEMDQRIVIKQSFGAPEDS